MRGNIITAWPIVRGREGVGDWEIRENEEHEEDDEHEEGEDEEHDPAQDEEAKYPNLDLKTRERVKEVF